MRPPLGVSTVLLIAIALPVRADVSVGSYTFADAALIDQASQVAGSAYQQLGNGHVNGLDSHFASYSFDDLFASQWDDVHGLGATNLGAHMIFECTFVDNVVVNEPGPDLVLFDVDVWDASGYAVAVSTPNGYTPFVWYPASDAKDTGLYQAYWWWHDGGVQLNWFHVWAIEIDLSDFGLPEGAVIRKFQFGGDGADPLGAAALNSASPLPVRESTWGAVKALYRK